MMEDKIEALTIQDSELKTMNDECKSLVKESLKKIDNFKDESRVNDRKLLAYNEDMENYLEKINW